MATPRRLHYLSVPPNAARAVVATLREAGLVDRARIIMEKPFGTDLRQRQGAQRRRCTRPSPRSRSSGSTTSWARRPRRTSSRSVSPTACSSRSGTVTTSTRCRSTCPRRSALEHRVGFYEQTGAYRDMVVTHLFQVLAFVAMEPPTALEPRRDQRGEEQGLPVPASRSNRPTWCVASTPATATSRGRQPGLRHRDLRRIALRDRQLALGRACRSTCAPASAWPKAPASSPSRSASRPRACSRQAPASGRTGPDHLTFDLADMLEAVAVVLRQTPRAGHAPRQAEPAP